MGRSRAVRPADNPFATSRVDALRYRLHATSWLDLDRRIAGLDHRCAVVGAKGSGKSTLLAAIAAQHDDVAVLVRIPGSAREPLRIALGQLPDRLGSHHLVLLDSAEQLGALGWRLFSWRVRCARGLIITAHRPGRLPTLLRCEPTSELLDELVQELAPDDFKTLQPQLGRIFDACHGDIRCCLRRLYDLYAGR